MGSKADKKSILTLIYKNVSFILTHKDEYKILIMSKHKLIKVYRNMNLHFYDYVHKK